MDVEQDAIGSGPSFCQTVLEGGFDLIFHKEKVRVKNRDVADKELEQEHIEGETLEKVVVNLL